MTYIWAWLRLRFWLWRLQRAKRLHHMRWQISDIQRHTKWEAEQATEWEARQKEECAA